MKPLEQLRQVLVASDLDVLTDDDYSLLDKSNIVDSVEKGKALAQFIKNFGTHIYSGAYADGRAAQAYQDGLEMGKNLMANNDD